MARPIFDVLREIRAGGLLTEATDGLAELVRAVANTDKGGEISIRLKVRPASRGSVTLVVDAEVVKKIPEPDREVSFFFPTKDGSLTKQDPNQMPLGLKLAGSDAPPLGAAVDTSTGEILAS